jgi:transcriptional regulator with XRE-family HTH domain
VDVASVIKNRLSELGADQRDLAAAAQVTESYVSQLLTRKKSPPAPGRTDIYERMGNFLQLPAEQLSRLAEIERREEMKKRVTGVASPLFKECRSLILRKCNPGRREEVRRIFEKEPFGELEKLVTQKLLDVAQGVAGEELRSEEWSRVMGQLSNRSYEQMRVAILEFLDTEISTVSLEGCVAFLDPMIDYWDIDLKTFCLDIFLNPRLTPARRKRFAFAEQPVQEPEGEEAGLEEFLKDKRLSGDMTKEETEFLRRLRFAGRRPTALYYYRELQNLRDPLHFVTASPLEAAPAHTEEETNPAR